jgi:predicted ATPase/DNA-binding SARP family transcriptional activator
MPDLALFLLGPPRVALDGVEVPIPRRKAMALLAYLAVSGQRHRRDALATLLWPEEDGHTARAYLRRALTALRNALGRERLDADRETVALNPDLDLWLDIDAFRAYLRGCRAHGHPADKTCPACLPLLTEAAALHRGDFLEGFTLRDSPAYDDWQFFQTQGLRDELAGALKHLVSGHTARGEFEPAIAHARRWLALDTLYEPTHRALMLLYARSGQRAAALRQYAECERVLREELGASPEEETTRLYEEIRAHREPSPQREKPSEATPPTPTRRHNLPAQLIPFVGREALLTEIGARLADPDCRLLTLIGPGGSGKTRLALEAAARQLEDYAQGVFFVSLAALDSAEGIVPAIAQALDFRFYGEGKQKEQLIGYLRSKSMLLILDNYEHLLAGAELAAEILEAAPGVVILATSRARLNVRGEHLHPIPGMDVPPLPSLSGRGAGDEGEYSAVKLFLASARRVRPDFELTDETLSGVVQVCHLVEGMPLGILLAAAWMGMLTPAEIATEIERGLDILETDWRDVPARQRTMRAVFDHSWALLGGREHEVLQGLSVFRGGFTRDAAERVAGASLRDLMTLVNRSLLHRALDGRYEVHELLRQYAAGKLAESPDAATVVRDRHAAFYATALEGWNETLKGPRQLVALTEVEADVGNVRAAWEWVVGRGYVERLDQGMDGLCRFYEWRGRYKEGEATCRAAVELLDTPGEITERSVAGDRLRVLAKATAWRGVFARALRRIELTRRFLQQSLVQLEECALAGGDVQRERAFTLWQMGHTLSDLSGHEKARQWYEGSLALYRELGQHWETATVLHHLGDCIFMEGSIDEAEALVRESLAIQQNLGDHRGMAGSLRVLGSIALTTGRLKESERLARQSVAKFRAADDRAHAAEALVNLGDTLMQLGKLAEAHARLEESAAIYSDLGFSGRSSGIALAVLGQADLMLGRYEQVRARVQVALTLSQERGYHLGIASSLLTLGNLAIAEGEYVQAQQLLQQLCSAARGSIDPPPVWWTGD